MKTDCWTSFWDMWTLWGFVVSRINDTFEILPSDQDGMIHSWSGG